jgi:hypothetical protein
LSVKHDDGMLDIHVMDTSEQSARQRVMSAEGCPERAIRKVRAVTDDGFELALVKGVPKGYRKIKVELGQIRKDFSKNGQYRPDKVPMPYQADIEGRWRRVYGTRDTGARYVVLDNLRVMVEMPAVLP